MLKDLDSPEVELDLDFCKGILENKKISETALLQVIYFQEIPITEKNKSLKYNVALSDGICYYKAIFCKLAAKKVQELPLLNHDIIKITDYIVMNVKESDRAVVIANNFECIYTKVKLIIGKPVNLEDFKKANFLNPFGFNKIHKSELFQEPKNDHTDQLYSQYLTGKMPLEATQSMRTQTPKKMTQATQNSDQSETKKKKKVEIPKKKLNLSKPIEEKELSEKELSDKFISEDRFVEGVIKKTVKVEVIKETEVVLERTPKKSATQESSEYVTPASKFKESIKTTPKNKNKNPFPDPLHDLFSSKEIEIMKNQEIPKPIPEDFDLNEPFEPDLKPTPSKEMVLPVSHSQEIEFYDAYSSSSRREAAQILQELRSPQLQNRSEMDKTSGMIEFPLTNAQVYQPNLPFQNQRSQNQKSSSSQPQTQSLEYLPIKALTYLTFGWVIKARVLKKTDIKPFSNKLGKKSKMFSVDLLDKELGEIEATFFGDLCDLYFNQIDEGKVYFLAGGSVRKPSMKQTHLAHDYQIVFDIQADVREAPEDPKIPKYSFQFTKIPDILKRETGDTVDVLAFVCEDEGDCEITLKTGEKKRKRSLQIFDHTKQVIEITFWGNQTDFVVKPGDIIIIKSAKISEFQGKKGLVSYFKTYIIKDLPPLPEISILKDLAHQKEYQSETMRKRRSWGDQNSKIFISDLFEMEKTRNKEEKYYLDITATLEHIQDDPMTTLYYMACPQPGCGRKVVEVEPFNWRCTICHKDTREPQARYKLMLLLTDMTGQIWTNAFDKIGEIILNVSASEMRRMRDSSRKEDELKYLKYLRTPVMKEFNVRLLMKYETFKGKGEWKYSIMKMNLVDYVSEARIVLEALENLKQKI